MCACDYPSSLSDQQWKVLKPCLPAVSSRGRPPTELRLKIDALLYRLRSGCQWRFLPREFGPWQTIYGYFRRLKQANYWQALNDQLRSRVRAQNGRKAQPTAAILDSQTVRSADHRGEAGYDAGKKTKGRKRHLLVDTLGLVLAVAITPANVPDREGAKLVLEKVVSWLVCLRLIWADGGYSGCAFAAWVAALKNKLSLNIVERSAGQKGFKVLPRRWVIERTFGWLMKQRILVRDYESTDSSAEAWICIALIRVMLRRLA